MNEQQPDDLLSDELAPDEIEIEAIGIEVSSQPIELYKVFKIANLVNGGGEAKHIISEGYVAVNGEIETRKRRKMYDGDLVEFNNEYYVILCDVLQGDVFQGDVFQGDLPEDELPEVFEDELLEQEYQVSPEEAAKIEQQAQLLDDSALSSQYQEPPQQEQDKAPTHKRQDSAKQAPVEPSKVEPSKEKGRKSIKFF